MLAATLRTDPLRYLRLEDPMEVMAVQASAEGANDFLNERDKALAKMIAQEVGKVIAKLMKGRKGK